MIAPPGDTMLIHLSASVSRAWLATAKHPHFAAHYYYKTDNSGKWRNVIYLFTFIYLLKSIFDVFWLDIFL